MLAKCSEAQFESFLKDKEVKKKQGNYTHETLYVDKDDHVIASMLTSSWSRNVDYRIEADNANSETLMFISERFK